MQDADFQEKMFAKQIAVMKGQAWNVVETLKIHDHGPLELTRRSRVLVWDDLVDIPVAQPMRASTDATRRTLRMDIAKHNREHEADLGAGQSSAPQPSHAALTPGMHSDNMHTPNRFNTSRQSSPEQVRRESEDGDISLLPSASGTTAPTAPEAKSTRHLKDTRPHTSRSRTRLSYDEPRSRWFDEDFRKRTASFTMRRIVDENDEEDGDLGFAAAREQEGKTKKVIVERLETVKSKNPVFTWC